MTLLQRGDNNNNGFQPPPQQQDTTTTSIVHSSNSTSCCESDLEYNNNGNGNIDCDCDKDQDWMTPLHPNYDEHPKKQRPWISWLVVLLRNGVSVCSQPFLSAQSRGQQRRRHQQPRLLVIASLVAIILLLSMVVVSVLGWPFPDRQLPYLGPLPDHPRRAFAILHSDSNPCYDMVLYVCLYTWQQTKSKYPLLVLHSVPLPDKVQRLLTVPSEQPPTRTATTADEAGLVIPVSIPVVRNRFVIKDRVRTAAAKFAVWNQTAYDQVAYFDSDTIFYDSGDDIFDATVDQTGSLWLYARPYTKYWQQQMFLFNSGNFLIRPHTQLYHQLLDLFHRRFWIMSLHQFLKTADQGFLNAVFGSEQQQQSQSSSSLPPPQSSKNQKKDPLSGKAWGLLQQPPPARLSRVKHVKFWLAVAGPDDHYNITQQDHQEAQQLVQTLQLQDDLQACLHHRRYSN